jgi:hypothetical protein
VDERGSDSSGRGFSGCVDDFYFLCSTTAARHDYGGVREISGRRCHELHRDLSLTILYINSNLIYVNPILNLMGYHIFEVDHAANKTSVVICKRHYLKASQRITAVSLGDYLLLEKY